MFHTGSFADLGCKNASLLTVRGVSPSTVWLTWGRDSPHWHLLTQGRAAFCTGFSLTVGLSPALVLC